MKVWFIRHNNESIGPYTVEELKNLSVKKDDYVWKEGLADWTQVKSLPELNCLFVSPAPPPFIAQNNNKVVADQSEQDQHSFGATAGKPAKSRSRLLWIGLLLILSLVTYIIYANNHTNYVSPFDNSVQKTEELKVDLAQTERQSPLNYIKGTTAHHKNLIGEMVIQGTITNSATLAVFKDVVMQADFLSKTNSIVGSEKFVIYEVVKPGQTVDFKKKILVPSDVKDVNITIMEASPAD